jgi:hypothetical protein
MRKLIQRDLRDAIVHDEKYIFVHPKVKCFEPFKEYNLCPPLLRFAFLKQRGVLEFPMNHKGSLSEPSPLQQNDLRPVNLCAATTPQTEDL